MRLRIYVAFITKKRGKSIRPDQYFPVHNGYVALTEQALQQKFPEQAISKIKIGVQKNVQVVFGGGTDGQHCIFPRKDQIIDQVFAAGLDLGSASGSTNYKYATGGHKEEVEKRAKALLKAAYEGAIRWAALREKNLFLTIVGGGVFNNNLAWVAQALEDNIGIIKQSGIVITFVVYDLNALKSKPGGKELLSTLKTMVDATGGTFTIY
jgi:hypothetical protein